MPTLSRENERILREAIEAHSLADFAEEIVSAAEECVILSVTEAEDYAAVGNARYGGVPDLPASRSWPQTDAGEYLNFLMQINFADLPRLQGNELPERGMLYFFLESDEPATDVTCRVLFCDGETAALRRTELPEGGALVEEYFDELKPHKLAGRAAIDLPIIAEEVFEPSETDNESYDVLREIVYRKRGTALSGKMLGVVDTLIGDPRESAAILRSEGGRRAGQLYDYPWRSANETWLQTERENWRLLWTLYSDNDVEINIWDAGFIQVLIRPEDLAARDFSKIYAEVYSS